MNTERDVILDVGGHKGEDSFFYALQGFSVLTIEANPQLYEIIQERALRFGLPVNVQNVAISPELGSVDFFVNESVSTWSLVNPKLGTRKGASHRISVASMPLDEIIGTIADRLAYCKIDIEGMDTVALDQLLAAEIRRAYISVENGNAEQLELLVAAGYDKFKYVNQSKVEHQRIPGQPQHSDNFEHRFFRGSSGLWGEDTPGAWLDMATARATCESLSRARRAWRGVNFGALIGWFDLHAGRSDACIPRRRCVEPSLMELGDDDRFGQDVRGFVHFDGMLLRNRNFSPVCLTQFPRLEFRRCGHDGEGPTLTWYNRDRDIEQRWVFREQFRHFQTIAM
jgi:FkbM family methyltransferase